MSAYFRRITTICVMIILLFLACKCRKLPNLPKNVTKLVLGGEPVALGELPYQIAFKTRFKKDPDSFYTFCGGAIIGEAKILSAAHCFVEKCQEFNFCFGQKMCAKSLEGKYAVAGTVRNIAHFEEGIETQWRGLQRMAFPKDYKFPENDIAVLFVVEPFIYNDFVKPITMAQWYMDYDGLCLVSGYGEVSYSGDSGGPLVYSHNYEGDKTDRILIGIACGTYEGRNSLFSRVSAYQDFIARNHNDGDTSFDYFVVHTFIVLQIYTII